MLDPQKRSISGGASKALKSCCETKNRQCFKSHVCVLLVKDRLSGNGQGKKRVAELLKGFNLDYVVPRNENGKVEVLWDHLKDNSLGNETFLHFLNIRFLIQWHQKKVIDQPTRKYNFLCACLTGG